MIVMSRTIEQPPLPDGPTRHNGTGRRRRTFAQRFGSGFQAWARDTFSRAQLVASFKSLLWVVPLTILIWIYAEREQTSQSPVLIHIEARNSDPNRLVQLLDSEGRPRASLLINAEIYGPHSRVEQVKEKLDSSSPILIDVDPNLGQGHSAIPASILSNEPLFVRNGITLSNLLPSKIDVNIDPIEHIELTVRVPPSVANLEGPPVFQPARVRLSGPRSVLQAALAQSGGIVAYAQLENYREAGAKEIPGVPIAVPALSGPHITISPPVVSARFTVRKSDKPGTLLSVPVWARYPPGAADKYKIEYEPNVTDVQVTGPPEIIDHMNDAAFEPKPKAYFDVTPGDVAAGPDGRKREAPLRFDFGKSGLKFNSDDLQHKTITYTLTERTPGD